MNHPWSHRLGDIGYAQNSTAVVIQPDDVPTVYTSGLVFPILLGFCRHRLNLNKGGAISAMVVGGGLALTGKLMGLSDFGLYGFFLSGVILIAGSPVISFIGRNKLLLP